MDYKPTKELKSCYMDKINKKVEDVMKDVQQTKPNKKW